MDHTFASKDVIECKKVTSDLLKVVLEHCEKWEKSGVLSSCDDRDVIARIMTVVVMFAADILASATAHAKDRDEAIKPGAEIMAGHIATLTLIQIGSLPDHYPAPGGDAQH